MSRYVLPDLPYDYGSLEPHLSGKIMQLHHDKHHRTHVKTANECRAIARDFGSFDSFKHLQLLQASDQPGAAPPSIH